MKRAFRAAAAAAIVLSAALTLLAGGTMALAAGTGWRVLVSAGSGSAHNLNTFFTVVTPARASAWALGDTTTPQGSSRPLVVRWNGKFWSPVTIPKVTGSVLAASATSSSDLWAVTNATSCFGAGGGDILRWNGTSWAVSKRFTTGGELTGVTAIRPSDVWVFGGGGCTGGIGTWHFDGHAWRQQKGNASGIERASALSATSIWAVGGLTSPDTAVEHYNGKRWSFVSAPALKGLQFYGVLARSATSIWLSASSGTGIGTPYLVHWNGRSWTRISPPWPVQLGNMATDGTGGLWIAAGDASTSYVLHLRHSGAWSRFAFSFGGPLALARIPGTTSLFGAGTEPTGPGSAGTVWGYGPAA
jgi:hypothetical protein